MDRLTRWATPLVWAALLASAAASAVFLVRWLETRRLDAAIAARRIETIEPLPADPRVRYAAAWDLERAQRYDEAAKRLAEVRSAADPELAANAWFALGNVYFESGIRASREASTSDAVEQGAQLDLARDAYRAALRIRPDLHGARYNLELLERLSPWRADQGWRRNTDPVKIPPDRHAGWTTIQETPKRGLP